MVSQLLLESELSHQQVEVVEAAFLVVVVVVVAHLVVVVSAFSV